jgi:putative sterol carrier protein
MATLEEIIERIRGAIAAGPGLDQRLKFDLKGEGFIHIDGQTVANADLPADLVITISRKDLEALGRRELDPMRAIMTGRMKLSDMGLAMKLQPTIQTLFAKTV